MTAEYPFRLWATVGHPEDALGDVRLENHFRWQLVMASPFEAIVGLKADVGPVVTAGTIKSKSIGFNTLKYLPIRVENPANPTPEVTLLQSMSFIPLFLEVFL